MLLIIRLVVEGYLRYQNGLHKSLSLSAFHWAREHCPGLASFFCGRRKGITGAMHLAKLNPSPFGKMLTVCVSIPRNQIILNDATLIHARASSLPMHHTSAAMILLGLFNFLEISLYQPNSQHMPDSAIYARMSSLQSGPGPMAPIIIRTPRDL